KIWKNEIHEKVFSEREKCLNKKVTISKTDFKRYKGKFYPTGDYIYEGEIVGFADSIYSTCIYLRDKFNKVYLFKQYNYIKDENGNNFNVPTYWNIIGENKIGFLYQNYKVFGIDFILKNITEENYLQQLNKKQIT
ncbi:MAG: hypothetical protein QXM96_04350, partial [Candidatus Woesearchaeota archaeon]